MDEVIKLVEDILSWFPNRSDHEHVPTAMKLGDVRKLLALAKQADRIKDQSHGG